MEDPAVTRFREFLRIESVHPEPDYDGCIKWLKNQAEEIGLEYKIVHFESPELFAIWLTWQGSDPSLKSVMLNSHIDVVPVDPSKWKYKPFAADKAENGNIYARGSQDMKCVGAQYLEAIRRMKISGFVPLRTIHVSFVPDEEIGGYKGMVPFLKTKEFKDLNIGFALDEGIANPTEFFDLFYGERSIWQIRYDARGTTGHGSILHNNTAAEKIHKIINRLMILRAKEKSRLESDPKMTLGDVTTVNLTLMSGGLQRNVVPPELSVTFDIRVTPYWDLTKFHDFLTREVIEEAGEGVTYNFDQKSDSLLKNATKLDDSNVWWKAFEKASNEMDLKLSCQIFPAATDCRYIRQIGIPALGFSPMNHTPILLHDNDEYLNEKIFLRGIEIYEKIIPQIVNVSKDLHA